MAAVTGLSQAVRPGLHVGAGAEAQGPPAAAFSRQGVGLQVEWAGHECLVLNCACLLSCRNSSYILGIDPWAGNSANISASSLVCIFSL